MKVTKLCFMNTLEANIKDNKTKGQLNSIETMEMFLPLFTVEKIKIRRLQYQKNC